jgi:predicted nucleic acid-binding protein
MVRNVLVDTSFLIALLVRRDAHHEWAVTQARGYPPSWSTCEAALSEAFHLLEGRGTTSLGVLLRRRALTVGFELAENLERVIALMQKYSEVPMSLAGACRLRMTETLAEPIILTTDDDFRVYRRPSRQVVPRVTPE